MEKREIVFIRKGHPLPERVFNATAPLRTCKPMMKRLLSKNMIEIMYQAAVRNFFGNRREPRSQISVDPGFAMQYRQTIAV